MYGCFYRGENTGSNTWEAYYDNGREKTGIDIVEWAREVEDRGAGEILITSVDREGSGKGMDKDLISNICDAVNIPVIASGGVGELSHITEVIKNTRVSAVALAKVLHYGELNIATIKKEISIIKGVEVR